MVSASAKKVPPEIEGVADLPNATAAARVVNPFNLTPPVTTLVAWALFNERLRVAALIGRVFCLIGVCLVNWRTAGR